MPKVIFLNGPSSSGKTSVAKELQRILPDAYMHIGIDKIISMMPDHLNDCQGGRAEHGFWWKKRVDAEGNLVCDIMLGDVAKRVSASLKSLVVALLQDGHNVIIDEVCISKEQATIWKETLQSFDVLYVGVTADMTTLEAREKARGNRMVGSGRAQAAIIHNTGIQYDLMLDTDVAPIEQCAATIVSLVKAY